MHTVCTQSGSVTLVCPEGSSYMHKHVELSEHVSGVERSSQTWDHRTSMRNMDPYSMGRPPDIYAAVLYIVYYRKTSMLMLCYRLQLPSFIYIHGRMWNVMMGNLLVRVSLSLETRGKESMRRKDTKNWNSITSWNRQEWAGGGWLKS